MTLQEYLIHACIEYWHWHNTSMPKRCYGFSNIMGDSFVFVNIYIKQDTLILFEIDPDCFQNTPLRFFGFSHSWTLRDVELLHSKFPHYIFLKL